MSFGTVLSVAQTLFAALQCSELKQIASILGYKSQIHSLQGSVASIMALLEDAEDKRELSREEQNWIEELKDAVYDADDLLDEFVTLAEQKQQMEGEKASKKVRLFFSRFNPVAVAYDMSRRVKKIRKKLDAIANNHSQFGFSVDSQPIRRRREETCSYVFEGDIIGREGDLEKIVSLLLDSNVRRDISFLPIVGIGGLGKTALAQLVYNDAQVVSTFSLRLWTCVSDDEHWDIDEILRKILAAITGKEDDRSTKELMQSQLRAKLMHTRYLLVLDDVWTENRNNWLKLVEFLLGGQKGSWIVVTTRSHETARIVGSGPKYELKGLSDEKSWDLFERTAFESKLLNPQDELVKLGQEIVRGCAGVPLAIRVAGSLLYGQDRSKWISFREIGLCKFKEGQNDIMPILKLSYHQLDSRLKSCFTYCAIFPKDYVMQKEILISLWMAQGYIVPFDEGQTIDYAAEEYFSILLRRCFFQDVKHDECGEIFSCKMHDLMHDMALRVAGKEFCVSNSLTDVDGKVRHLAHMVCKSEQHSFSKSRIRSFLCVHKSFDDSLMEGLLANWMHLRVLDLQNIGVWGIKSLPGSIGDLIHLRYLNLSRNEMLEVLPKSIIKLYNLETLMLRYCSRMKELPKDLNKLVKLRVLDINGCTKLTSMPWGMNKLTHLRTLTEFVADGVSLSWKHVLDQLAELKDLNKLTGKLCVNIRFPISATEVEEGGKSEGGYLKSKENLNHIFISWRGGGEDKGLMEEMQPHSSLKALKVDGFHTQVRMPSWARENNLVTSLPNLLSLNLWGLRTENSYNLTCLGNLPRLKDLTLGWLKNLEYIIESSEPTTSTSIAEGLSYFPSLEKLALYYLKELKGWRWRSSVVVTDTNQIHADGSSNDSLAPLRFSQLKTFYIEGCPNLIASLQFPALEDLHLTTFNMKLQIITVVEESEGDKRSRN